MGDIQSRSLLIFKAVLLVMLGLLAGALLLFETPSLRNAALLAIAIWAFCRAYYFAFYVVQHYMDPEFRFAGLSSVVAHLYRHRQGTRTSANGGARGDVLDP